MCIVVSEINCVPLGQCTNLAEDQYDLDRFGHVARLTKLVFFYCADIFVLDEIVAFRSTTSEIKINALYSDQLSM